jgi:hypothetical protein
VTFGRSSRFGRLEGGIRSADAKVDEIALARFDCADMRAAVQALLEHGQRGFQGKFTLQGR